MSPSNNLRSSPYTPEQMRKVLRNALSPTEMASSPLSYKCQSPAMNFESGYCSETSSDSGDGEHTRQRERKNPHAHGSLERPRTKPNEGTPIITVQTPSTAPLDAPSSPVRPLCTPSPSRNIHRASAQTYEVEAPFLQAMIGLLERQANIAPDHVLTKSDVRKIVRKEVQKHQEISYDARLSRKTLSSFVTSGGILGLAAGVAGLAVYQRVWARHPEEMRWYVDGGLKGGLLGLAGAVVVKGMLWGLDQLRRG
ncbi:hypothetical protein K505DRAFT_361330 [Melanomma pulvis-pyrius CBS 109.77]|uniref:Uncharacterized protein n=1 Tax=Melanomma pulvis-pyrius CBS 109.77 TaxID=1314802 RepID=A0A6A6XD25_9PLEO|nr:hypothetical protein K505DRAFT_361330 [Melanomma pulvis-pyrius CBS 109.77]